jgi:hypothetical protein
VLPEGAQPAHIGDFVIYDAKSHSAQIADGAISSDLFDPLLSRSRYFIQCAVEARDGAKAVELADALFYRLELIMRVFIGLRTTRFEVGILNYVGPQMRDRIVIAEGHSQAGSAWKGALDSIPIADSSYCRPSPPLARLLSLITKQNNEFEVHVIRCAEWTGQAIGDPNEASAFVKAATALEVLFSTDEKGIVTPSIMARIAEGCAFVLGSSPDSARRTERQIKHLYEVRSAVVHSGKNSVEKSDLDAFIRICRAVVISLLDRQEFGGIDSVEKLWDHFRTKKYSSCSA